MIEIQDFITERGGNPEKIRESQRRRGAPVEVVDEVIEMFEDHKKTKYEATQIGAQINAIQKEIGLKKKNKENADDLLKQKEDMTKKKVAQEELAAEKEKKLAAKAKTVGNYVHDSVPYSLTEDDNAIVRTWKPEGVTVEKKECLSHHEVLYRLGGYDPERGVKIVGHRGYCLTGMGLFLNLALVNYGLEFLYNKGYQPNAPPFMMLREQMAKTAQLEQFDEELYKVTEDENNKDTDKYLIATSEQPLSALHSEEWLQPAELPIKYAGYSTCFRKEAGSHGRDAWGIFRVHQFEKIEQFLLTKPEDSWAAFDSMIDTSEEFYKSLKLPYQVVAIVSGALNNAAAKKFDLEAWFPFQGEYKELVSCSNCTDYQTRELEIRFGSKKQTAARKEYVHALNSTLAATERCLCCILENYQTPDGFTVPEVLRKYIPGQPEFLPFVRELPKDTTSAKAAGKAPGPKPKVAAPGQVVDNLKNLDIKQ
ncbi:serine-tRNA ligase [Saccharata proteae CBS 121410]|uniref:serine--tRNA ligase n=1 Tax=Saccharata proteae CBS 121410 TaxID=1314787 RepID=A0A9P4HQJ4_9PEZI|nr:serine-tRNA ligase [Saccharata proteae CBS 121410]